MHDDAEEADVVIVNTCCFILDAKDESIRTILDAADLKKNGDLKALIVTGCMAERYRSEILKEIPEVDAVVGTTAYDAIAVVLEKVLEGERVEEFRPQDRLTPVSEKRKLSALHYVGYLKIAEGCDKHCTYCAIPSMRGHYRSYPMDVLVSQAKMLADSGVKELILVAQETTVYGVDLYGKKKLPTLLRKLCRRILKLMGRRTSRSDLEQIVNRLREAIPDITLRTTLISGFPGETEEDHEELLRFVEEMRFDHLGVFPYSREEGTPAAKFPSQVPARIKKKRRNQVMRLQQKVSAGRLREKIGTVAEVLVEGRLPEEDVYIGRTCMDAPDVDGYLFFTAPYELMSGTFVKVRVTDASEYDLKGEMI